VKPVRQMQASQALKSEDGALVQAVLDRRPGAFEALVRDHEKLCWHIINRMVREPEDTRELCQETFLRVHRNLHQFRFENSLKSWIGRVAFSVAVRHLKRKRIALDDAEAAETVADQTENPERAVLEADQAAELHRAIEALPPVQRMLLTLYHLDELPIAEVAIMTGLSAGTIKSHLFRSRAALRRLLLQE
jgi:RNA polymerase sigma-70 factor (ECF subfamily)